MSKIAKLLNDLDALGEKPMPSNPDEFLGYHKFQNEDGEPYGSFEIFLAEPGMEAGYYWWSCYPGCMPGGEATGPFPTSEGAYLDAIGD